MGVMVMPPLPKMKKGARPGSGPQGELDRVVHWRIDEEGNSVGWCAQCHQRRPAIELRWRPDRVVFGEEKQGSWECRECNPRAGKWEVLGVRPK